MKVRELKEKLEKLDPNLELLCHCEDENLVTETRGFVLFDVAAVETPQAERLRLADGTPYLKFEITADSNKIAILEITSDF